MGVVNFNYEELIQKHDQVTIGRLEDIVDISYSTNLRAKFLSQHLVALIRRLFIQCKVIGANGWSGNVTVLEQEK